MAVARQSRRSVPTKPLDPPASDVVPGHPELKPAISRVVNTILDQWPNLVITSTTGGQHASGSYHYVGRACDLGTVPFDQTYQDRAAEWIATALTSGLKEGIHNPSLSVKNGKRVPNSTWGAATWEQHRNHIHCAA